MQNRPQAPHPTVLPDSGPLPRAGAAASPVERWAKPVLSVHGDVRQLTMGTSPPPGESGAEGTRRP